MTRLSGVKAVSFDVDGTLWDFESVQRRALGEVLRELEGRDPDAAAVLDVERLIETRDRVHEELRGVVVSMNDLRVESFRRTLRDVGRPDEGLGLHLSDVCFQHRNQGQQPFDDVVPVLEAPHPRYTLGILSNGNSYAEDFGLERWMSFQVFAQDRGGVEKPGPRIFQIALESAGCSAHQLVHVGDSLQNDVAGAAASGVRSVWLNHNGAIAPPDAIPDAEIASLHDLLEVLE